MKVVVLGHSYVRDLSRLGNERIKVGTSLEAEISYLAFPGIKFSTFIENQGLLNFVFETQPEHLVVILGGNDFDNYRSLNEVKTSAEVFYRILKNNLPNTRIYATQVETRFYTSGNHFDCPLPEVYKYVTNYFNKKLRKLPYVDNIICILGPGRLSNRDLFKADGVHLKLAGVRKLWDIVRTFLVKKICESQNAISRV